MTTAMIRVAKNMVSEVENLKILRITSTIFADIRIITTDNFVFATVHSNYIECLMIKKILKRNLRDDCELVDLIGIFMISLFGITVL